METGSYLLITRGMTVQGTDGDLGTVAEVVADKAGKHHHYLNRGQLELTLV